VKFDQVHKEALEYVKEYRTDLVKRGGSTCTVPILDNAGTITGYKQQFIPWMKDYHEEQRRQLSDTISSMIKEGKSVKHAAKDVEDIFDKYKGHAESTIQTESRKANTAGALNRYKKAGVQKWEWSTAGSDVCPYCATLEGQQFDYDSNQPRPPLHSRCRCRILAVVDLEAEIAAMEAEMGE
jgi:SPP1 gp7 family putative phage head morphogenesis protein